MEHIVDAKITKVYKASSGESEGRVIWTLNFQLRV